MSRVFGYFWASIDHKTQTNPVSVVAETPALIRILPIWPLTYCLSWPGSSGALPGTPAILRRLQSVLWNYKLLRMHPKAVWLDFSPSQFRVSSFLISCFGWFPHTHNTAALPPPSPPRHRAHLLQKLGHIVDFVVDDDPRRFEGVLLLYLCQSVVFHCLGAFLLFTHLCDAVRASSEGWAACPRLYNRSEGVKTVSPQKHTDIYPRESPR